MTAANFGMIISNVATDNAYAVLANGQVVVVQSTGGPTYTASFYTSNGTLIGGPVTLNASGPDFSFGGGNTIAPRVAALANGGFAVLGQNNAGGTSTDYAATFDAGGNPVNGWTKVDSHTSFGNNAILALSSNGYYVGWNTTANAGASFNPLLNGTVNQGSNVNTNQAFEGIDAQGAVLSSAGAVSSSFLYNSGTLVDQRGLLPYNGLAGNQAIGGAVQIASGAVVQTYQDVTYDLSGNKFGQVVDNYASVSFSMNGGKRVIVYAQGDDGAGNATGLPLDTTSGEQAVALSNGKFAVIYTTVDDSNIVGAGRVHNTYASFYNPDGTSTGAPVLILRRSAYQIGNDSYPGGGPSVVALPSGGFAMAYYAEPTVGSGALKFLVSLFDAAGNQTQTVAVPFSSSTPSSSLSVGLDGTLYVEDDLNNIYTIVGTAPGDVAINASADTAAETLAATSTTRNYIIAGSGATTILGNTGADTLQGGTGGDLFFLGASTAVVSTKGADTIVGSKVGTTVNGAGSPLYFGAAGPMMFNALGTSGTLAGGGAETINAGSANLLVFGGTGGTLFNAGGGASTVVSGTGGGTLNGGGGGTLYFGTGPTTYNAGAGVDTVVNYAGGMTATGGVNGTVFFTAQAGGNVISSGSGSSTIFGFGVGDTFNATGSGTSIVEAAGASETINGAQSSGTDSFFAFAADNVVIGGAGQTAIQSAFGNHTLVAGSGSTLFELLNSGASRTVTIQNFNAAQDFVQLQGYGVGAGAAALQTASVSGGSEILTLSDGSTVTFQGVTNLTAGSFL